MPAFLYDKLRWIRFTQKLPPNKLAWYVAFDGVSGPLVVPSRRQNFIRSKDEDPTFREAASRAEVELETSFTGLAKVREMDDDVFGKRPLLVTNGKVTDPDKWKPFDRLPTEVVEKVRKRAVTEIGIAQSCTDGIGALADAKVKQNIQLASSSQRKLNFVSSKRAYLLQLELPSWIDSKNGKKCEASSDFGSRWAYFVDSRGNAKLLGGDVNMIEAADLDGDGSSELLLSGQFVVAETAFEFPPRGAILLSTKTLRGPVLVWSGKDQ